MQNSTIVLLAALAVWPGLARPTLAAGVYVGSNSIDLWVIDPATNKVRAKVPGTGGCALSAVADGSKVYSGLWPIDATKDLRLDLIDVGPLNLTGIAEAVSPDGSRLYLPADLPDVGGSLVVIDTRTRTVIARVPLAHMPDALAVAPDGRKVYVASSGFRTAEMLKTLSVIDAATNEVGATIDVGKTPFAITVAPDGKKVYVANVMDNTVSVIDAATSAVGATVALGKGPRGKGPMGVAVAPDGSRLYVASDADNTVTMISTATNAVSATTPVGKEPSAITIAPDGRKVYVANYADDTVSVIDTTTNAVSATVPVGRQPCGLAFAR